MIGREAFRVSREDALDHVAGYTIVNDITTRDLVFRKDMKEIGTDWYRSKNAPGFLPTGPFLVPAPFVDGGDLNVQPRAQRPGDAGRIDRRPAVRHRRPHLGRLARPCRCCPATSCSPGSPPGNGQHWKRFLRDGDVMTGSIAGPRHPGRALRRRAS